MNENLKVNANSSVLEHKRKHNLLVENLPTIINEKMEQGETMEGYSAQIYSELPNLNVVYAGVCKNGNKITFVIAFDFTTNAEQTSVQGTICAFVIPSDIGAKLYAYTDAPFTNSLDKKVLECWKTASTHIDGNEYAYKQNNQVIEINCAVSGLSASTKYICRIEKTFLLSENLVPETQGE